MSPADFADLRRFIVWWNADNTGWADFRGFNWREFGLGNVSCRIRKFMRNYSLMERRWRGLSWFSRIYLKRIERGKYLPQISQIYILIEHRWRRLSRFSRIYLTGIWHGKCLTQISQIYADVFCLNWYLEKMVILWLDFKNVPNRLTPDCNGNTLKFGAWETWWF